MRVFALVSAAAIVSLMAAAALAQRASLGASWGLIVYPTQDQSAEQQAKDEGECLAWGRDTTGVDPANPQAGVRPPPRAPQGGEGVAAASGALRGAARGALIGNLADRDGGDWALGGALIGSVRGAREREAQNQRAAEQARAQTESAQRERMDLFKRAFSVCMQGRHYTVG